MLETLFDRYPLRSKAGTSFFLSQPSIAAFTSRAPSRIKLKTLRDAVAYISKLPKAEHDAKEWQTAMHCLIEAADSGGPIEFARMGMLQAIDRHVVARVRPFEKGLSNSFPMASMTRLAKECRKSSRQLLRRLCLSEIKLAHTDDEVRQEMA